MNLIIDIGNTNSKFAIFENDLLIENGFINELQNALSKSFVKRAIIVASGIINPSLIEILKLNEIPFLIFINYLDS